ncbi:MFS transporter [Clostridium sp. FP2]|uniref:MFS transporter n=1 Tax=Clostridium TaxID=1485 RepID=UPI0013E8FEA7|nr:MULTISPECIES: MFS transporter [Clostridium]MBW9159601.1 MFS transporter [Clostridium tagluense]MBZ9623686.1 MFS transporter [Clostridium sp. FP2]WLC63601.1 MFS transporter [Clostridium tagluense]
MGNKVKIKNNLVTSIMLGSFAFGLMSFILPIYSKRIGGSALAIGGLFSIFSIVTLVLRPLIGKGIDKYGRKVFFVSAFLFYAIAMLLFSYSTNIELLYISRIIQAIGSSFMWISAYSIAIDIADNEKRGKLIGQVDGASSKGALYGAIIGFVILGNFTLIIGWSLLFKGYAILSLIAGYIAYKYIPETMAVNIEKSVQPNKEFNINLLKLLCIVFISSISTSMISPLLMIYLQDKFTTDIGTLATAFIPAALVYAFLPSILGEISDKIGRIVPMVIGLIVSGIVSLGFSHSFNIKILIALWIVESIGIVMASPAEEALVADIVGKETRGSAYGLYLMVVSLGASIGPLLGGFLYDTFGHAIPFYLNGIILLMDALLVIILFRNYKKKQSNI